MVILKPGLLLNRDNDYRFAEKLFSWVPFIPKVSSEDWAKCMVVHTTEILGKDKADSAISLSNSDIKDNAKKFTL